MDWLTGSKILTMVNKVEFGLMKKTIYELSNCCVAACWLYTLMSRSEWIRFNVHGLLACKLVCTDTKKLMNHLRIVIVRCNLFVCSQASVCGILVSGWA